MRIRSSAFTLLEITLAMLILSIVGTVVSWQVHKMITHHQFESEGERFCIALQQAQVLAVTHQTDFEIRFHKVGEELTYTTYTDEPLPVVDRQAKRLKKTQFLTLNGKKKTDFTLKIYSSGRIEPHPVIGFHRKDADQDSSALWIDLQTPVQITLSHQKPKRIAEKFPTLPKERAY